MRSDLSEPTGGEHDTVRAYGGQLDPLAQDPVLQAIVEQLRVHRIQFVLVRSSNTLDQAFLSQFLRRAYPQGRVVLDAADELFLRSRQDVSLRGIMVLTTYPLIAEQHLWTPSLRAGSGGSVRVFGQDTAEAIYVAARNLVGPGGEVKAGAPLRDYLPPLWASQADKQDLDGRLSRPATWLTVISHRRFWPVAALTVTPEGKEACSLLAPASLTERKNGETDAARDIRFPLEMQVLLLVCAVLALWHLYCCWFASVTGPVRALSFFVPLPVREHRQLIFFGSLVIGLMGVVLEIFGAKSVKRDASLNLWAFTAVTTGTLLLFPMLSLVGNFNLPRLRTRKEEVKRKPRYFDRWRGWPARYVNWQLLILAAVLFLAILMTGYAAFLQLFLMKGLTDANRFPVMWRSVNVLSGVSPLTPQILLLLGLYGWLWCNLSGAALMGDDRPRLPKEAHFPPQSTDMSLSEDQRRSLLRPFSREEAQNPAEQQALPLGGRWWRAFAVCLVVTTLVFRMALQGWHLRNLGGLRYGYVMFGWLVLCVAILLADTAQVFRTWTRLQQLLAMMDRLRVRRTLAAMKGIAWGSLWGMSGNVLEERYRVLSREVESLEHLAVELQEWMPETLKDLDTREAALKRISTCLEKGKASARWHVALSDQRKRGMTLARWRKRTRGKKKRIWLFVRWCLRRVDRRLVSDVGPMNRFQAELAETAGVIVGRVLIPEWSKEKESLLIEPRQEMRKGEHDGTSKHHFASGDAASPLVRAGEESFLLQYLGFLQNTLGRIRSMVLGMLVLFVGATLAVSSYPFDPLPMLGGLFLAVFVIVGAAVVSVYAAMHRDTTLSYVTNTNPGELGLEFWGQLVTFGIGPLFALLTTLFPSLTDFLGLLYSGSK